MQDMMYIPIMQCVSWFFINVMSVLKLIAIALEFKPNLD